MAELGLPLALQSRHALRGRVARARGGRASSRGSGNPPLLPGGRPGGAAGLAFLARRGVAALCLAAVSLAAHAQVISTRIWPARDYTRVTLESKAEIKFSVFG